MDVAPQATGRSPFDRLDTARYIDAMARELADLARPHPELALLVHLLDIAHLEAAGWIASFQSRRTDGSG